MTEADVKIALARRHKKDFYITNVKNGPSWTVRRGKLRILDAWAMRKSWTAPRFTGYEIKVSRSDFLGDDKWEEYLPYCEYFFFACPKGMIKPDELPDGIGLVYVYPDSFYVKTVKRAKASKVDIDPAFFMYILMNKIDSDHLPFFDDRREALRAWADGRIQDETLAMKIRSKIAQTMWSLGNRIDGLRHENNLLRKVLSDIGFDVNSIYTRTLDSDDRRRLARFRNKEVVDELQGTLL